MRYRIWVVIGVVLLAVALSSCMTPRAARGPVTTPVPTKTLRPTFTHTPAQPTMTSAPTVAPATATPEAPTVTPEPPTAVASPTSEVSRLSAPAAVNVRSGPGTNYAQIGRLQAGQSFAITGKNPAGDWWQFDFNGRSGWVLKELVRASGGERVQVAANISPPPTARPVPTRAPQRPAPTRPPAAAPAPAPAASYAFAAADTEPRPNTNPLISVWCRVFTSDRKGYLAGTLHVTRGGATVAEQPFSAVENRADPGLPSMYVYNGGCKIELPDVPGNYSAFLVQGNTQVSDTINFVSSGDTRIFILTWMQK